VLLTDARELRALLERHGFSFSRSLGQNFLTAAWVPERIAAHAALGKDALAVEIGPGVGCLTVELARRAGKVLAVEKDESLRPVLTETLAGQENVELRFADALRLDLAALVREGRGTLSRAVACANLPYNVTSDAVTALLEAACFESVTVMVQREAAQRFCALPGERDYNAASVLVRWYAEPERLFDVPPDCFTPRPKVTSSVLSLTPRKTRAAGEYGALFPKCVRAAFALRRKTLCNALCAGFGLKREDAEEAVLAAGLDARVRGEALGVEEFARLTAALAPLLKKE
jgi:16S rRNA (adenine1518-N6/adenine1519-N6)-dimethyltransferase